MNAFTVDVEDYFQVTAFEKHISRSDWDGFPSRVVGNTRRVLEILSASNTLGTFYILGWVAERFPKLVQEIHTAGHEIASHGFWHRLVYQQTPDEFRQDICASRDLLQDLIGEPVTSYRAPSFSVTRQSLWALEILAEEGYRVDSSIFPIHHHRYGVPDSRTGIHELQTAGGPIIEFPPTVIRLGGFNFPVAGGGYFRLYPFSLTQRCLRRLSREGQPFMFYTHPWELDAAQPRLRAGRRLCRFRHHVNLSTTAKKLKSLLSEFPFGRVRDVMPAADCQLSAAS